MARTTFGARSTRIAAADNLAATLAATEALVEDLAQQARISGVTPDWASLEITAELKSVEDVTLASPVSRIYEYIQYIGKLDGVTARHVK